MEFTPLYYKGRPAIKRVVYTPYNNSICKPGGVCPTTLGGVHVISGTPIFTCVCIQWNPSVMDTLGPVNVHVCVL